MSMAEQKTTLPNNELSERISHKEVKTEHTQSNNEAHIPPPAVLRPRLVLDTSLFVNPDAQHQFGENVDKAVDRFLKITRENNIRGGSRNWYVRWVRRLRRVFTCKEN